MGARCLHQPLKKDTGPKLNILSPASLADAVDELLFALDVTPNSKYHVQYALSFRFQ